MLMATIMMGLGTVLFTMMQDFNGHDDAYIYDEKAATASESREITDGLSKVDTARFRPHSADDDVGAWEYGRNGCFSNAAGLSTSWFSRCGISQVG